MQKQFIQLKSDTENLMNKKNYLLKEFNSKKCYKTHLIQNLYIKNNIVLKSVTNYVQLLLEIVFLDRDESL